MATDPVRRIRAFEHEEAIVPDLPAMVARLAALSPSPNAPYLTVSFDWTIEGSEPGRIPPPAPKRSQERSQRHETGSPRRPGWQQMQRELETLVAGYGPRGEAFESLSSDLAKIINYVENELDSGARSVFIAACSHQHLFEAAALDVPVPSSMVVESIPALRPLVHAAEDYPTYALLNADQQEAFLWLMERQSWSEAVQFEASQYPRKQASGGLNQQRFQKRADERVEAFAKTISEQLTRTFLEGTPPPDYLILSVQEPMFSAISAELHEAVAAKLLGRITLPVDASALQFADAAAPMIDAEERRLEAEAVQAVSDGVGARALGIAGAVDTLRALAAGQVRTLVMNDDFSGPGWADYTLALFGIGAVPEVHPVGGDVANLVPTKLEDEAVRLALVHGGTVELVQSMVPIRDDDTVPPASDEIPRGEAATALDALGGIGAILRYALD